MRRISTAAAGFAIAAGALLHAVPAQADEPAPATPPSVSAPARHPLPLHYLHSEPRTGPHGLSHSVRKAHRPAP